MLLSASETPEDVFRESVRSRNNELLGEFSRDGEVEEFGEEAAEIEPTEDVPLDVPDERMPFSWELEEMPERRKTSNGNEKNDEKEEDEDVGCSSEFPGLCVEVESVESICGISVSGTTVATLPGREKEGEEIFQIDYEENITR